LVKSSRALASEDVITRVLRAAMSPVGDTEATPLVLLFRTLPVLGKCSTTESYPALKVNLSFLHLWDQDGIEIRSRLWLRLSGTLTLLLDLPSP
jgi:hypothetical protein